MLEQTKDLFIFTCDKCDYELEFKKERYSFFQACEIVRGNGWGISAIKNKRGDVNFNHFCPECSDGIFENMADEVIDDVHDF